LSFLYKILIIVVMTNKIIESAFLDKLYNLNKAMNKLEEIIDAMADTNQSEFFRDALIKRYEIVWDLIWKTLKEYLEEEGYLFQPSPKETLKKAYQENIINNEETWLIILKERNQLSHTYNEDLSISVSKRIINEYYIEFYKLLEILNKFKETKYDSK
jgi:nucleotidyltransferase substrate binding protein (TIGR01987 family)